MVFWSSVPASPIASFPAGPLAVTRMTWGACWQRRRSPALVTPAPTSVVPPTPLTCAYSAGAASQGPEISSSRSTKRLCASAARLTHPSTHFVQRADPGFHAAEAEMVRAGADFALAARADHVARAVLIGAEERAAAVHALLLARLGGIEGCCRALRVARDAAGRGKAARSSPADTSRCTTPRRCRPCRRGRSRSAGNCATGAMPT